MTDSCILILVQVSSKDRGRGGQGSSSWWAPPAPVFPLQNQAVGKKADFSAEKYTGVF